VTYAWPGERQAEAEAALAKASRLTDRESEEVFSTYAQFEADLLSLAPGLVRVGDSGVLAILGRSGRNIRLVTPQGIRAAPASEIRDAICTHLEEPHRPAIESLLDRAQIPLSRRPKARAILLSQRLANARIRGIWILRPAPDAPFLNQLRFARVPQRLAGLVALHTIQYTLWILSWWVLGSAVLSGHFDRTRFLAWVLLLATLIPCRLWIAWLQGTSAIIAGGVLKQRLFFGALRLHPDAIRHQGVGQLLGRVIESEAVESLALSGGLQAMLALVELAISAIVLGVGGAGALLIPGLVFVLGALCSLAWLWLRRYRAWTGERLAMTHNLVENMIGHRTRLAQQPPEQWHTEEDAALADYEKHSRALDRAMTWISGVPRVWLVLALVCISGSTVTRAVTLGAALLAFRALRRLTASLSQVLAAYVAAGRVAPLFRARPETNLPPSTAGLIVDAYQLAFRYPGRSEAVLANCSLQIKPGERIVLEGASGGGKSTFASVLTGLRAVESGSLAVARIAAAPQFHDNHVLAETFAFNALMARNQVPEPAEIAEAEALCRELGLGELLERMPAGMLQLVGESGWQLSHGESSRLYIARALLQPSDLLILDESFAALDPENLQLVMDSVLRHASGLLVIAHR
jgi:ATP-binding cassette, subfamily B, bacterial